MRATLLRARASATRVRWPAKRNRPEAGGGLQGCGGRTGVDQTGSDEPVVSSPAGAAEVGCRCDRPAVGGSGGQETRVSDADRPPSSGDESGRGERRGAYGDGVPRSEVVDGHRSASERFTDSGFEVVPWTVDLVHRMLRLRDEPDRDRRLRAIGEAVQRGKLPQDAIEALEEGGYPELHGVASRFPGDPNAPT